MKDKKEQIQEIAQAICGAKDSDICQNGCCNACGDWKYAERAYSAGYRKATEVIDELVKNIMTDADAFLSTMSRNLIRICASKMKKELAAEMRQEVEK